MSFASLSLPTTLLRAIDDLGFTTPTPIQAQAIPPGLAGRDVLACAMTGSGKTAAFLLPILNHLLASPTPPGGGRRGPRALVVSPTRELAAQTAEQLTALARHTKIRGAAVFGGVGMGPQEQAFRRNTEVLIATPGRLLDHLQNDYATLSGVEILVLDEADRMLDMGFLPDIRRILAKLPAKRQNLLFSATMPGPIITLTRELLRNPVEIAVDRVAKPATGVSQAIYPVRHDLKPYLLLELLRREPIKNLLVFTRTKHRANRLAEMLARHGVACERIHGNRSQAQRTDALARFKQGAIRVLVATDIAARGIDVEALSHVVNFDVPNVPEDYIHRVGRTARADATGDAWTFVADEERGDLAAIEKAVGSRLPRLLVDGFDYAHRPSERFEVPIGERIAEIRARKAEERARAKAKAERRAAADATRPSGGNGGRPTPPQSPRNGGRPARPARPGGAGERGRQRSDGRPSQRPAAAAARPDYTHVGSGPAGIGSVLEAGHDGRAAGQTLPSQRPSAPPRRGPAGAPGRQGTASTSSNPWPGRDRRR